MTTWTTSGDLITNLLPYSEDFSEWTGLYGEAAGNYVSNDPFGNPGGTLITDETTLQYGQKYYLVNINGTVPHTFSCFVEKDDVTNRVISLRMQYNSGIAGSVYLNTSTGEVVKALGTGVIAVDFGCDDYGTYWRPWISSYKDTLVSVGVLPAVSASLTATPAASNTGSAVFFGAQLETGTNPTGYIATNGEAVTTKKRTEWARV